MKLNKIKSHAKINLSLNVTGKKSYLHKIESIISFIELHDEITIKDIIAMPLCSLSSSLCSH